MDTLYYILIYLLVFGAIAGTFFPIVPSALLAYGAVLLGYFTVLDISTTALILWGVGMIIASMVDNILPPIITRRFGGSRKSSLGSLIGLLVGSFFIPPVGMLLGAFLGALLGERMDSGKLDDKTFHVALGSFLGVIVSSGVKLIYAVMILVYLIFRHVG